MNRQEIEALLVKALRRIAPDIDFDEIDRNGDLREALDIDSMDFLNLVTALSRATGAQMPESDYARMGSVNAMLDYLEEAAS